MQAEERGMCDLLCTREPNLKRREALVDRSMVMHFTVPKNERCDLL